MKQKCLTLEISPNVRYNKHLTEVEKKFYSELRLRSTEQGLCLVEKNFFSIFYKVHQRIISSWVHSLEKEGLIAYQNYEHSDGKKFDSYTLRFPL
jgi:hypothetical protein